MTTTTIITISTFSFSVENYFLMKSHMRVYKECHMVFITNSENMCPFDRQKPLKTSEVNHSYAEVFGA